MTIPARPANALRVAGTVSREKFPTRTVLLRTEAQRNAAITAIRNAPLDESKPLEVVIREQQKVRGLDANARMWAGPLRDIASQAYVNGRTYSAEVWHSHFKREFLPEEYDETLCKEGYRKWDTDPGGNRVLVGSTTQLTKRGFALYLQKLEAYAVTELGVMLSAGPNE